MNFIYKFKLITWYLSNPKYYKHFIFLLFWRIKRMIFPQKKDTESLFNWCKINEIELEKLIENLFSTSQIKSFYREAEITTDKIDNKKMTSENIAGASYCDLIYNICFYRKPKKVLELGVALGWSSYAFLLNLINFEFKLVSNDMPYPFMKDNKYVGSVVPSEFKKNWILYRHPDISILNKIFNKHGCFDIIHYDSDKSYYGRLRSYEKLYNNLNENGIFISDDINDNFAFKHFVEKKKLRFNTIKFKNRYLGIILK